jgi:hypothetical protein
MNDSNDQGKSASVPAASLWTRPAPSRDATRAPIVLTVDRAVDSARLRAAIDQQDSRSKAFATAVDLDALRHTVD